MSKMDRRRSANTNGGHGGGATASINSECWDSVSYLESAFHHGFMRLRLRTGEFVYNEDPRLTRELDEFCDVDSMHTPKGPVILLGESGMGKSAFLANWLRILREIKEYFELNKEIPDVEERLSWQFPRFLEAASKKGRVILVVDGLHRLHTNNGESILKWVPLAFPPNVRIIFSGTLNYPTSKLSHVLNVGTLTVPRDDDECAVGGDYYEKTSLSAQMIERIKMEAGRRNWKLIHVLPLAEEDRRRIVKRFISKSRDISYRDNSGSLQRAGLQLFEIQQNAIVGVPMNASPHFLKNFLTCLLWAVKEGFNIHTVFESWLGADSVAQLLESVLRSMEIGYTPDQSSTDDAMQFLREFDGEDTAVNTASSVSSRKSSIISRDSGRRNSQHQSDNRTKIELARAAAEAAVREASDSLDDDPLNPEMKRVKSVHETKEVFVNMVRNERSSSASSTTQRGTTLSKEPPSPGKGSPTNALLEAAEHRIKRFPTEPRAGANKLGSRPDYLTGGRSVAPLGDVLGRALCLLYVSRHGLLLNELRFILNAVVTEVRGVKRPRKDDAATGFGHRASIGQEKLTAFSEDEWQVLLRALRTLGVLFVQEVLVLPMCKDILRDVIWWRYIGSERAEQQYHQWLIRFFRIHPTTFRRVEELPWHLKRCYQWDALRQVLVNLPMFQLLYTASYKGELFGYWKVLTDGPLLNYGAATNASDPPVYVTPFDVVKEYGKSIDDWYRSARPTTKRFTAIVQQITRFMYEFCLSYQRPLPQFMHAPFDLKRLYLDGFLFAENLPHVQTVASATGGAASALPSTGASSFAHFQDYPQSEWDLKQSYNHRVVLKLQALYDTVKAEVAQKQKYLQDVKRKTRETSRRYELTMRECDMAKHAAEEMSSRLAKLEQVMKNIDQQEKTHRKLIRGCELFPACAPAHFEANKKELRLLQMQLKDLQDEKKVLYTKKTHLQNEELPILRKAVEKSKQLLSAVVDKLERAREKVAHDQASSVKLYQRRLEMIESVRSASGKGASATTEEEARRQARQSFSATTRSLATKVALQQCESMCDKIQKATGFSKMELIFQKFSRREELNASFEEQAKLYEARLKQIKLNQAELEEQLHSLELSQATATTEDPRILEQKLRSAEVELARTEYTQASLLTSSKEIEGARSDPDVNFSLVRLQEHEHFYVGLVLTLSVAGDLQISESTSRPRRRTVRGGDEKNTTRSSRYRRPLQLSSVAEKSKEKEKDKDRAGFDRGAVPPVAAAAGAVMATMSTQPSTPELGEGDQEPGEDMEVLSRETIKASSRNKLAQRKRGNM
ncbi:hypothetical protein PInf_012353 [Phytophthora infestans]|nr:hypothetical protein PInf_012353 [Phytophthora infestans]